MSESNEVVARKEAQVFLANATLDTVSAVATLIADPSKAVHSTVRLIRAVQTGKFVEQLSREWDTLRADGRIAKDYGATDQCRAIFSDLLESLESDNFDSEQLEMLRRLFLAAASEKLSDRNSPLPREYISIGRSLSAGELEILAQTYRFLPTWREIPVNRRPTDVGAWLEAMQASTRLKFATLVEVHEDGLMSKKLLLPRMHSDRSGIRTTPPNYRLTDLAVGFCEFLDSSPEGSKS